MDERGITPIIATILLVGLSVASISMVAIVVSNLAPSAAAPLAEIGDILVENVRSKSDNMTKITFVHKGGDFVYLHELKVTISGRDNRNSESSTTIRSTTKRTLKLGDVVEVATPATQGYYYPKGNEVRVSIVHEPTGTVLADTKTTVSEPADGSEYGFESGTMGWEAQTYVDSRAITAVSPGGTVKFGYGSLRCAVNLVNVAPDNANKSKGETFVDMQNNPPAGITVPVNLNGVTVSAWVYCPPEASGPPGGPYNGLHLFFKDATWKNRYSGNWITIPQGGGWVRIWDTVGVTVPGYQDSGFDYTKIQVVGVKIGTPYPPNGNPANNFNGFIYIDGFNW